MNTIFLKLALVYFMNLVINIFFQPNIKGKDKTARLFAFACYITILAGILTAMQTLQMDIQTDIAQIFIIIILINFILYYLFKMKLSDFPVADYYIPFIVLMLSWIYSQIK